MRFLWKSKANFSNKRLKNNNWWEIKTAFRGNRGTKKKKSEIKAIIQIRYRKAKKTVRARTETEWRDKIEIRMDEWTEEVESWRGWNKKNDKI